jgi:glucose-1-phosphate thymidylyltransferase
VADYNVREVLASRHSLIGVRKVDDPRSFGVAELAQTSDRVTRMIEKPLIPKSNMAMVGIYFIRETAAMFSALESHLQSRPGTDDDEGEYHLTAALQAMLETGIRFDAFRVANWFDCGKKETLLATNATLLKQQLEEGDAKEDPASDKLEGAVIIPPVSIAEGCKISGSIIGPNVTIGENTRVESSIIRDSIIGSYAKLVEVVLQNSIIGSDAFVRGLSQSLNIGDNTEIDLG